MKTDKLQLREVALATSSRIQAPNGQQNSLSQYTKVERTAEQIIADAEKIYQWLIQDGDVN